MDKRLENACREALATGYTMMVEYGWSQFKAYGYAYDLLEGISMSVTAMKLYGELPLIRYYKRIAFNRSRKA